MNQKDVVGYLHQHGMLTTPYVPSMVGNQLSVHYDREESIRTLKENTREEVLQAMHQLEYQIYESTVPDKQSSKTIKGQHIALPKSVQIFDNWYQLPLQKQDIQSIIQHGQFEFFDLYSNIDNCKYEIEYQPSCEKVVQGIELRKALYNIAQQFLSDTPELTAELSRISICSNEGMHLYQQQQSEQGYKKLGTLMVLLPCEEILEGGEFVFRTSFDKNTANEGGEGMEDEMEITVSTQDDFDDDFSEFKAAGKYEFNERESCQQRLVDYSEEETVISDWEELPYGEAEFWFEENRNKYYFHKATQTVFWLPQTQYRVRRIYEGTLFSVYYNIFRPTNKDNNEQQKIQANNDDRELLSLIKKVSQVDEELVSSIGIVLQQRSSLYIRDVNDLDPTNKDNNEQQKIQANNDDRELLSLIKKVSQVDEELVSSIGIVLQQRSSLYIRDVNDLDSTNQQIYQQLINIGIEPQIVSVLEIVDEAKYTEQEFMRIPQSQLQPGRIYLEYEQILDKLLQYCIIDYPNTGIDTNQSSSKGGSLPTFSAHLWDQKFLSKYPLHTCRTLFFGRSWGVDSNDNYYRHNVLMFSLHDIRRQEKIWKGIRMLLWLGKHQQPGSMFHEIYHSQPIVLKRICSFLIEV
eukprot:TRINITY_DN3754_c0_g1_i2.p1 TRINITY_DN3754_c0_g1~~TRINITY_DN3754_c0_g1_i2.p1  ORF type:complete len:633 (+),score=58.63 TRINITY_DN3754_c0_g1_i2:98-1996(+)